MHKNCLLSSSAVVGMLALASIAGAGTPPAMVLNEYNAVRADEFLAECDTYFGELQGNGDNWVEFLVIQDGLDIRNWVLNWENEGAAPNSGSVTFQNVTFWSNLPAGTIITIRERTAAQKLANPTHVYPAGNDAENPTLNPCAGDWWIGVVLDDDDYVTHSGSFKVDNDDWAMEIRNGSNGLVQEWIGEEQPGWGGSGINTEEIGKLEMAVVDGTADITNANYDDGDASTFGCYNTWGQGANVQDVSGLRDAGCTYVDACDDRDGC